MNQSIRNQWLSALALLAVVAAPVGNQALANEFRNFKPIATPADVPEGSKPVTQIQPVSTEAATDGLKDMLGSWNKGDFQNKLAPEFFDGSRLNDAIQEKVPRDAEVRLMAVQGVQTLEQFERPAAGGKELISTVSVTADTQIEFNDPQRGFRRLEGTNEYILRITEEVAP